MAVLQTLTLKGLFYPFTSLKSLQISDGCERVVPVVPTDQREKAESDAAAQSAG